MQRIATRIFIIASLIFGVLGIILVLIAPNDVNPTGFTLVVQKSLMISVFIILPSFALSVASKYLSGKTK